jgi:hypothetical protein
VEQDDQQNNCRGVKGSLHLIFVYVDDILIVSEDENYISEINNKICAGNDTTDMAEILFSFLNTKVSAKHR